MDSTLIIAPHFLADVDSPANGFLYWGTHDWVSGNDSLDPSHMSSYEVMDLLLKKIFDEGHFRNLRQVIITGLSAGGQFTDRFVSASATEPMYQQLHFRYIIASPSSYLYFDDNRYVGGTKFEPPSNPQCLFNQYRYGLDNRNRYMSQISDTQIKKNFSSRDVVLAVGDQDDATSKPNPPIPNDPKDGADLDVSCAAEYQGASRLERAKIFASYLNFTFPGQQFPLVIGNGIAHQLKLYASPEIQNWL